MKLKELADRVGGIVSGDPDTEIRGVSSISEAKQGEITFLSDKKYLQDLRKSRASAIIVKEEIPGISLSMLIVDEPYLTFAKTLEIFYPEHADPFGVSDRAFMGKNVRLGEDVNIYPGAFISDNVVLGAHTTVSPGVYIGKNVSIGNDSYIHANTTIRDNTIIGENVTIHPGTVIGSDGFGYVQAKNIHHKIPQVGGVIIEDNVEIGANVTIDRATVGNTIIGRGTKIDNLVQIGHNVRIGCNCIIIAQVGIGGSVEIGDGVIIAGQAGIKDHVRIGKKAVITGQTGIVADIPDGQVYSGMPAIPHTQWLRAQSIFSKLPEHAKRLKDVEKRLAESGPTE